MKYGLGTQSDSSKKMRVDMKKIAVLITCHNRKFKTLSCLSHLFKADKPIDYSIDVFLVDDGSTDGTSDAVLIEFPDVNIISGTGTLFWNKGMLLAWKTAVKYDKYDHFLWLNDDTNIDSDGLTHLVNCYNEYKEQFKKVSIACGSCRNEPGKNIFSYGLKDDSGCVYPDGKLKNGKMLNGNFVLIPKDIFKTIGFLSDDYTHAMGDYDYGLRALENNFTLIPTKKYVATCPLNVKKPIWRDSNYALRERWINFNSPIGLNIREYKKFRKRFWPKKHNTMILKAYLRLFFPKLYNKIVS